MHKLYITSIILASSLLSACAPAESDTANQPEDQVIIDQPDDNNSGDDTSNMGDGGKDTDAENDGNPNGDTIIIGGGTDTDTDNKPAVSIDYTANWQVLRPSDDNSQCITASSANSITVEPCLVTNNQQWSFSTQGLIMHKQSNKCLDAGNLNAAQAVTLKTCALIASQIWHQQNASFLINNFALDLNHSTNQVIVYPFHGGANQVWNHQTTDSDSSTDSSTDENNGSNTETEQPNTDPSTDELDLIACPNGSEVYPITPSAGVARMGSIFSKTLYNPNDETQNNKTHQPQQIQIQVTNGGTPVANCQVAWLTNEAGEKSSANGWVFPDNQSTDAQGKISAWWTAGDAYEQMVNVVIKREDGSNHSNYITGKAQPHKTRSNSVHINWSTQKWDHFSVDVTPLTMPATTYYSAINFPGGYTGLQTNKYLFSIWDVNGIDAEIVNPGIATCTGFGGEGTGAKCYVDYNPSVNSTYRFEVIASYPIAGRTDYSMYFTDIDNGQRTFVAQLRYGKQVEPNYAAGFVEDWWEPGSSCLETNERSVYFHNIKYKKGNGTFTKVNSARATAVYNQWHNEICANYKFTTVDGKFLWSSGGKNRVGYPQNVENTANASNIISLK